MKINFELENSKKNFLHNLPSGSEVFPLEKISQNATGGVVHICKNDVYLEKIHELISFFIPAANIYILPAWDTNPYDKTSPNSAIISERLKTLAAISGGLKKGDILLTTANAVTQKLIPAHIIKSATLNVKVKQNLKREELLSFLVNNSFVNSGAATDHGEFSVRGSIIDIFPPSLDYGLRVDFFGDEVESIRKYDTLTQISSGSLESFEIIPASEVILSEKYITRFKENYLAAFGLPQAQKDPLFEAVTHGRKHPGFENYLPFFYDQLETIFDYCPNAVFTFEHDIDVSLSERFEQITDSYNSRVVYAKSGKYSLSDTFITPEKLYVLEEEFNESLKNKTSVYFSKFSSAQGPGSWQFNYRSFQSYFSASKLAHKSSVEILKDELIETVNSGVKLKYLICPMSEGSKARLKHIFQEHGINTIEINDFTKEQLLINKSNVGLCVLQLESGFEADGLKLISEPDLMGEKIFRKKSTRGRKAEDFIREAANLNSGELVVHKEHGIGRFKGLETLTINKLLHDFILIEYAGGDKLYVPVENIELISRFGSEDEGVELDKLGGLNWQERTARIKNRIKLVAEELIKVAALRHIKEAKIFDTNTGAYEEFCARFPYVETDDQLNAISDVVNDIASGKTMDRLICGDVGFGKTEVALRAAFAVVQHNNETNKLQVAVVCPTTLLARQHYNTFKERFYGTGIEVRQLSRMVSSGEMRKTKTDLKEGRVDIVIGTHALLASSLEFKNLSMLIIDEEQRFGVGQKEKLKKLRADIHVLTLTATPIPRTLQLSLSGIRDLSLIATPPVDRLAVRSFVMPYDEITIREAILKEHYRGGRTYFVAPRVKDIVELQGKLKELVPEVKVVMAHGKMKPDELDQIMNDFYEGKFDVLLSTTIVESGLDVTAANTIILYRADMFGLAQLYQLRGRVGRSKVRAYAYFTVPPRKQLTRQAEKRLEVMQKLDSLGAGFTLASYDMDIRGFGNLLGDEQSGNIKEVGVELYQNMLQEAIEALKAANNNEEVPESETYTVKLNLGISVLIPENFVTDGDLRMGLYRRLGNLNNNEEIESFAVELVDRFGPLPEEVENLLETIKIKFLCKELEIEKLDAGALGASLQFRNNKFSQPDALISLIGKNPIKYKIKDGTKFVIANCKWEDLKIRISELKKELVVIKNYVAQSGHKVA